MPLLSTMFLVFFFIPAVAGIPVIAAGIIDFAFADVVLGLLLPSSLLLLSSSLLLLSLSLTLLSSSLLLLSCLWSCYRRRCFATIALFMHAHILFLAAAADDVPSSVADPGCLSRILIFPSMIPDLGSRIQKQQQKRGWKFFCCHTIFWSHKFHIIKIILFLKCWRNNLANFQRIIELFTQKIATKLSKIWVRDPVSEIRKKTYSGSRIQGSKKHRIADPDPQRWSLVCLRPSCC